MIWIRLGGCRKGVWDPVIRIVMCHLILMWDSSFDTTPTGCISVECPSKRDRCCQVKGLSLFLGLALFVQ